MSWWSRLLGGKSDGDPKPQRLDYLSEAMALERQGDYDAALTSYRLALRDRPNDTKILQNMAIAFTKTNRPEEAIRCYRSALESRPSSPARTTGSRSSCSSAATGRARRASRGVPRQAADRRGSGALDPPRRETLESMDARCGRDGDAS